MTTATNRNPAVATKAGFLGISTNVLPSSRSYLHLPMERGARFRRSDFSLYFRRYSKARDVELQPIEKQLTDRNRLNALCEFEITDRVAPSTKNGNAKCTFVGVLGHFPRGCCLQTGLAGFA
jgi:hypothetical protein